MPDLPLLLAAAAAFMIAGCVKGIVGMGLPTVAIGLLTLAMPPVQAVALLIVPALLTNVWQMVVGPGLGPLLRRLWPLLIAVCLGTWAGAGFMTGPHAAFGVALLGAALIAYAGLGLSGARFTVAPARERVAAPVIGIATGLVSAATGVSILPAVPYLQAIGLEKDELVQALGLFFIVSTVALAGNVALAGAFSGAKLLPIAVATGAAFAGMALGQRIRRAIDVAAFRRWFLIALSALGATLLLRALG